MNTEGREQAFMSALVTEHFALQGTSSSTISEGGSRSSIYLLSVSTSLVALGFTTGDPGVFAPMAAAVLPTLVVLGWFTIGRLTDLSIENVSCLRAIAKIRRHYASLTAEAGDFFPTTGSTDTDAQAMLGISYRRSTLFFTMASMIGLVNAVLAGAGLALLLDLGLGVPRAAATSVAATVAVALFLAAVAYQRRRFGRAFSERRS